MRRPAQLIVVELVALGKKLLIVVEFVALGRKLLIVGELVALGKKLQLRKMARRMSR